MDKDCDSLIKHREIRFCTLHPDPQQAHGASLLLADVEGIHRTHPQSGHSLQISYDVTIVTLKLIEEVLQEVGYHLDNSLLLKLKRALFYFCEENQRANLGLDDTASTDIQVSINRYLRRRHGCRDQRPEHWRNYW